MDIKHACTRKVNISCCEQRHFDFSSSIFTINETSRWFILSANYIYAKIKHECLCILEDSKCKNPIIIMSIVDFDKIHALLSFPLPRIAFQ